MSEHERPPHKHTFSVAQLQSILTAVSRPRIEGHTVAKVTISTVEPNIRFMGDAVAVEFLASSDDGHRYEEALIVADDGRVLTHLSNAETA